MNFTIPDVMHAIQVINPGENSQLAWQTVRVPKPAPGQLLLKTAAAGINRADLMQRQGRYPAPKGDSDILGLEASGIVVAVGDTSLDEHLGHAKFGLVNGGGYAEYVILPASQAIDVPVGWSMAQAAATAETFLTAYQLLFTIGQASAGQRVLLHAGASGVGTSAIMLAKAKGLQVAVTVGSNVKAAACLKLGADSAINYREDDFVARLLDHWPTGCDLILDPVAGSYLAANTRLLALDGKIIVYAMMGGRVLTEFDLAGLFQKRGQLLFSTLRNRDPAYKQQLTADFMSDFADALHANTLQPVLHATFAASDVDAAHALLRSNNTIGKLVLCF